MPKKVIGAPCALGLGTPLWWGDSLPSGIHKPPSQTTGHCRGVHQTDACFARFVFPLTTGWPPPLCSKRPPSLWDTPVPVGTTILTGTGVSESVCALLQLEPTINAAPQFCAPPVQCTSVPVLPHQCNAPVQCTAHQALSKVCGEKGVQGKRRGEGDGGRWGGQDVCGDEKKEGRQM